MMKTKENKYCEACGCNPCDCGWGNYFAGVAQLVEHHVANVNVVGSNPITRSILKRRSHVRR